MDGPEHVAEVQAKLPGIKVVGDPKAELLTAFGLLDKGRGEGGGDAAVPAVVLFDDSAIVRWVRIAESYAERPGADEVLAAITEHLEGGA